MNVDLLLQILVNGLMSGGMYALVASGFTLILGVIQVFNFAQGHFYMLGAFVTFGVVMSLGLPYPVAIIVAMAAMGLLGIFFHFSIIRWVLSYGMFHTLLITIAFGTIVNQVSLLTFGYNDAVMDSVVQGSFNFGEIVFSKDKMFVIICAIIVMIALHYFMRTKIGTAMLASAENREVAGLQGINTQQIFWIAMAVGCALSGIAGGLIVPVLAGSYNMGEKIFIKAMIVVVIGGMGSMSGALLAAFLVGIIESFAFQFVGELNVLVVFAFMGVLTYFRPGGLLGKPMPIPGQ